MKKILALIVFLLLLSSCSLIRTAPKSYTIYDTKYVTGFYGYLHANSSTPCFVGDLYGKSDDLWEDIEVEIDDTKGIKIQNTVFDMYSVLVNAWQYKLYVNASEYDEAKAYYASHENFHYSLAKGNMKHYNSIIEVEDKIIYSEMLDKLLYGGVEVEIRMSSKPKNAYYFYKISVDGLLTSIRVEFSVINNELYSFLMERKGLYYYGKINEEVSNYFVGLIESSWDS